MALTSPTKVQFDECVGESKNKKALPPTKRYDRKEIQKRLDVENWIDDQMQDLFDCKVRGCKLFQFTQTRSTQTSISTVHFSG